MSGSCCSLPVRPLTARISLVLCPAGMNMMLSPLCHCPVHPLLLVTWTCLKWPWMSHEKFLRCFCIWFAVDSVMVTWWCCIIPSSLIPKLSMPEFQPISVHVAPTAVYAGRVAVLLSSFDKVMPLIWRESNTNWPALPPIWTVAGASCEM